MIKQALTIIIGCSLLAGCKPSGPVANPDPNHTHADFAVWVKNRQIDFSGAQYMSEAASEESAFVLPSFVEKAYAHEDDDEAHTTGANKYLHLHDGNGHVIHRHKPNLTLEDFFLSIGFHLDDQCFTLENGRQICNTETDTWQMFVNGVEMPVTPDYDFDDLDRILLTYDATDDQIIDQLAKLSDDACLYSRTCPERGDPPVENCIADPEVPCVLPE